MILLEEAIETPNGVIYPGAVKIIRKRGSYEYVIKRGDLIGYAYTTQLRFLK